MQAIGANIRESHDINRVFGPTIEKSRLHMCVVESVDESVWYVESDCADWNFFAGVLSNELYILVQ